MNLALKFLNIWVMVVLPKNNLIHYKIDLKEILQVDNVRNKYIMNNLKN